MSTILIFFILSMILGLTAAQPQADMPQLDGSRTYLLERIEIVNAIRASSGQTPFQVKIENDCRAPKEPAGSGWMADLVHFVQGTTFVYERSTLQYQLCISRVDSQFQIEAMRLDFEIERHELTEQHQRERHDDKVLVVRVAMVSIVVVLSAQVLQSYQRRWRLNKIVNP